MYCRCRTFQCPISPPTTTHDLVRIMLPLLGGDRRKWLRKGILLNSIPRGLNRFYAKSYYVISLIYLYLLNVY